MKRDIDMTKLVATTIAIVSGAVTLVTLILINIFDAYAFMEIMKASTLMFICSGGYLIGYDDGAAKTKLYWGISDHIDMSKAYDRNHPPKEEADNVSEEKAE